MTSGWIHFQRGPVILAGCRSWHLEAADLQDKVRLVELKTSRFRRAAGVPSLVERGVSTATPDFGINDHES